ncbi:MAG: acyl carrier protein [Bacteroidales bacterium]|nr:acyl carrier protein [Bacteroidales bacterium]
MANEQLILEVKEKVIKAVNLVDLNPEDIDAQAPIFGEGLGLDSIDALEFILLLERDYGIKLKNPAEGKQIFKSIATMADYIEKNRTK